MSVDGHVSRIFLPVSFVFLKTLENETTAAESRSLVAVCLWETTNHQPASLDELGGAFASVFVFAGAAV